MKIYHSVGIHGVNNSQDVKVVQNLLNKKFSARLSEDGVCGPKTIHYILHLQKKFMAKPDGLIDVNGKTFHTLAAQDAPGRSPAPVNVPIEPQKYENVAGVLQVKFGQVTFDAEGNDIKGSTFFSRRIHWPPTALSGVTIGRGYDIGSRKEEDSYKDLTNAGVPDSQARMIASGSGLKGGQAKIFVDKNRDAIGEISHSMQKNLFELIYPGYIQRAANNYRSWTSSFNDAVEWNQLKPAIRDVLVDFVYQGFTKGDSPMKAGMHNDVSELITYIQKSSVMQSYEKGRQRVLYLKQKG
ncbi:pesticin C-terminus-like muramidase [Pantoea vagans]|uniref:pesticin C-terminus-like muramidase n=1 Tax=Pantoea vagans TaxID=470934 RepID=UPI0023AFBB20|nr:pesticin C-terminus-like muramidase [Pantoea vagans]MDE8555299.1 pesticin C-terminus-like muramidase [Pantoea vagans]MDE8575351.1 pesticin C-terminus-like muramidase [Pantoea vagans]